MGLHSVGGFCAMLQYSFTRITIANDGNVNFPEQTYNVTISMYVYEMHMYWRL